MPKRTDIKKILVIGAGPIVIGQACEFDYSGTQACKALREEGYEVVLLNSNPATIMTDTEFSNKTYVEPVTPDVVRRIIERDRPDAITRLARISRHAASTVGWVWLAFIMMTAVEQIITPKRSRRKCRNMGTATLAEPRSQSSVQTPTFQYYCGPWPAAVRSSTSCV